MTPFNSRISLFSLIQDDLSVGKSWAWKSLITHVFGSMCDVRSNSASFMKIGATVFGMHALRIVILNYN